MSNSDYDDDYGQPQQFGGRMVARGSGQVEALEEKKDDDAAAVVVAPAGGVDIEALALKIYELLRQEIRIERERSPRT